MKFQIRTILLYTALLAIQLAMFKAAPGAFLMILLMTHLGIFALPFVIVMVAIVSGRQVDSQLEIKGNPYIRTVMLIWLYCLSTAFLFWCFVIAMSFVV